MKLEIEVTDSEIKEAIERKARIAIAEYTNQTWLNDPYIKGEIKKYWQEAVTNIIKKETENSDLLKAKVIKMIEAKLQGQVTAFMKLKKY